jgi:hypothetical protein
VESGETSVNKFIVESDYSESELSGSFKRSLIICDYQHRSCSVRYDAYLIQTGLELINSRLLDQNMFLVELLDDVFIVVLAVNVDQHGFDGSVAFDERA